jgi:flavin-binding protein dodecin
MKIKNLLVSGSISTLLITSNTYALERTCNAQLKATVPNGDEILLAEITGKGQDSRANHARAEAAQRAVDCLANLWNTRFSRLGANRTSQAHSLCRTSNIEDLTWSEVDTETKIRISACTTYRHMVEAGYFHVDYQITTYGLDYCGDKFVQHFDLGTSPLWSDNFCESHGFDFQMPY